MAVDVLILNSGEWFLAEELPAEPWHILIYRQRAERRNELHVWLPRQQDRGSGQYAFRRYWIHGDTRWCVELPTDPNRKRSPIPGGLAVLRIRFTAPDGLVLWSEYRGLQRLADFTDSELAKLRREGREGPFFRI